ncbi:MAG: cobalt/nickel transport system ATP-binding protein [Tepidanaerobacteraceae bacterium]|nr:cobalt/nickel transport system ATP-binding protein [Tepidanaerobacteraceae bacterium]
MSEYILEMRDVVFDYPGGIRALNGISMAIEKGKKIAVLGPNGSGKSTLFLHFNGILRPKSGKVFYRGQQIKYHRDYLVNLRKNVGIVFQDPDIQLFAGSVFQEVSFGPMNLGFSIPEVEKRVVEALKACGIEELKHRPTHFLSFGQKKRVSIADVLAMDPEVLVLDEPAAYLDPKHEQKLVELLEELCRKGKQVILSTHDVELAYAWADYVFVLKAGRLAAEGTPQEVFQNETLVKEADLRKPQLLEICDILKQKGFVFNKMPRNIPEFREELLIYVES